MDSLGLEVLVVAIFVIAFYLANTVLVGTMLAIFYSCKRIYHTPPSHAAVAPQPVR